MEHTHLYIYSGNERRNWSCTEEAPKMLRLLHPLEALSQLLLCCEILNAFEIHRPNEKEKRENLCSLTLLKTCSCSFPWKTVCWHTNLGHSHKLREKSPDTHSSFFQRIVRYFLIHTHTHKVVMLRLRLTAFRLGSDILSALEP